MVLTLRVIRPFPLDEPSHALLDVPGYRIRKICLSDDQLEQFHGTEDTAYFKAEKTKHGWRLLSRVRPSALGEESPHNTSSPRGQHIT